MAGITTNESAKFVDAFNQYYSLMRQMEEKGFHLEAGQLLDKAVKITFKAKEIKFSLPKDLLEKASKIDVEVTSVDLDTLCFPQTRISFTLPLKEEAEEE